MSHEYCKRKDGNIGCIDCVAYGADEEQSRILKLLEIGGPIEQIICDYWGDPEFDKDDALLLIEKAIRGGNKTNFEVYLEEQLKDSEVKEAHEQGENK